ncbi:hypothetical protein CROQUDRAFT_668923 [Cronartium quercuum f. sp. fusiforme G11]|uniref:Micro-fibrillar-associated protein 1 C-terminal domain-containing protein n=1 Tax=Cronartium quercuum f. sp. fusiforme G11 TaxID=708437 RepID=A0A9P6NMU3_9BASI|nr:hypothetical protein CROQUDRAFT_668923 [Cronartium quercuum f. sp. fusiforme G11]
MIELKKKEEIELRKIQSQKLVEQTLIRELAEKEVEEVFPDVDDTDGIEPEKEFELWRLRELKRLKREKDAMLEREKEKEELEARRALPESERLEDDIKFANSTRQSKPKGQRAFLQKYHHKGAFYTDAEILKKHDYTAPTESTTKRMDLLPESMQVRDFGKMSRTKWTHLSNEDTTVVDAGWNQLNGKFLKGCFNCGGPHLKKDCPNNTISGSNMISTGTNGTLIGKRPATDHDRDFPSKRREADGELRRDHNRELNRSLRKDLDLIKDRSPISRHDGRERSRDRNSGRDRSRYRSRDRGRDMSRDRDRDRCRDKGRDRGRDRSRDRIRDKGRKDGGRRDRSQDLGKDRDRDRSKDRDRYK